MALKMYTYGGMNGPFYYDDIDGPAFWTEGQGEVEEAPTQPRHVVRLEDLSVPPSLTGYTGIITVVTNVQLNAGAIEVKSRQITFTSGIVTTMGAETGWTATPL